MLEKVNDLYNQARELGGFKSQPLKQLQAKEQVMRFLKTCPICDRHLIDFHCSTCGLQFNPKDLADSNVIENIKEALIESGDVEDHTDHDFWDRQNQINESF